MEGGAVVKRIAVVEDEVYMREELCNMLQKDGYLVEAITEFEDAARLLAALDECADATAGRHRSFGAGRSSA